MVKKLKVYLIALMAIMVCITTFFGVSTINAFAFSGTNGSLTEQELYNETNTYNVETNCFKKNGAFNTITDSARLHPSQYEISYDLTQKNNNQVMESAQITILTHGLDSHAGAWSNDFSPDTKNDSFAFDEDSLISKIIEEVGEANVYWAKIQGDYSFKLFDIISQKSEYLSSSAFEINTVTDVSRHIIVVFDAYDAMESNANIYYQFNYMLSKIIYDVKIANGGILPKVNLVGHSRGGLTNLQYALDHPDLVSTLVSLGTPYFSSTTANLFGEAFMGGPSDGLDDILNPDIYYAYNARWNKNYNTLYSDIDVYAMGSYHTLAALVDVLARDYGDNIPDWAEPLISAGLGALNGWKLSSFLPYIADRITLATITEILDMMYPDLQVVDVAEILFQEINYDVYPLFVSWYNDILVNLESQLGNDMGADGHEYSGSFLGFNRVVRPFLMFDDYVDYEKVSQASAPVGHNLIARDQLVIAEIVSVLDLGVNTDSAYVTIENEDDTVTFVRYRGEYIGSMFYVPETIEGKTVTEISAFAFDGETNITEIVLPNTIKKISAYAFAGLENLTTITFAGTEELQLEKIGYGAFAGCENLTKFNSTSAGTLDMPASVEFIDCYAFYGTGFNKIKLGGNIDYIGDVAFSNISNLTEIEVINNSKYFSDNNVLYNSDGWLMQYPVGKSNTSYEIPSSVSNVPIRHISQFAFMGENNLETINLNNVISIDSYAFMGCTNLATFNNASNVEYVGPFALDDTQIMQETQDFVTLGKVLYKYNGTANVLNTNDFPTGITRISSNAFCCNDNIEIIYLPNNIIDIDNNAFADCPNLEEIIYCNTMLPDVGNYSFVALSNIFKFYCRKGLIDSLSPNNNWYNQSHLLTAIETEVYFEDIDEYTMFYYGETVELPTEEIAGKFNKGWLRVNESTDQTYGNYLTPSTWNETVPTATYRADTLALENYTMYFYNGDTQIGSLNISTGDEFSITQTGYTLNGTSYTFANNAAMENCAYNEYYGPSVVNNRQTIATFEGWLLDGEPIDDGQWFNSYSDNDLYVYADWEPIWFDATVYDGYSTTTTIQFNYCEGLSLGDPTRSGYMFKGWKNNGTGTIVSMPLRTTSNVSLTAQWVQIYTITYKNLTFMGQTADVLWDYSLYQYEPTYYERGIGLDLSKVSAFWQSDGPYSPQLRFLGWYTNMNFTTKVTSISASATGNKTYYAKWRYDQDNPSRSGNYYIDNSNPLNQDYDRLYLGLTTNGLADELEELGIDTLVIKFWIKLKGTGTASIHLYNGENILQTRTIADSEFSDDKFYVCECTFTLALSQIENLTYIDIRYQASTSEWWIFSSSDNWQNESIYYEKFYVVDGNDANSPEFYWHYQFPYSNNS